MRRLYKYAIIGLALIAIANAFIPAAVFLAAKVFHRSHAQDAGSYIGDKFHDSLEGLGNLFEAARDKGLDGYESFVNTLQEHQTKLDEYYHPEHKSWTTAAKDQYDSAVNKLKDWQCQAEEKIHELRYGKTGYSCEAKSLPGRIKDKIGHVLGTAKDEVKDKVKDTIHYDDLEKHFESARDEGKQQLHDLIESIKSQRAKLESTYDEILTKAEKTGDVTSSKAKEWRDHFKQSAGDSLRSFREMSDDFEQRIQDFLGTDQSRWGFFSRLKFW